MKKTTLIFLGLSTIFSAQASMAGGGHNHGHGHDHEPAVTVNADTAKAKAKGAIKLLIKRKKLEQSWSSIEPNSAEKKTFNHKPEWVVTFVNKDVNDSTKQKLYVFLTSAGKYIAANFTGN